MHHQMVIMENIMRVHRAGLKNQLERAHNIALIYSCRVPDDYVIDNGDKAENSEGYLKWFDKFPIDILECHKPLIRDLRFKKWC